MLIRLCALDIVVNRHGMILIELIFIKEGWAVLSLVVVHVLGQSVALTR